MKIKKLNSFFIGIYFFLPFIIFFKFFSLNFQLDISELFWAFKNSVVQSFLVATVVVFLSFWISLSLFSWSSFWRNLFCRILLLPQVLPSFFALLIGFQIWRPFPIGWLGIVFILTLIHLGYGAVNLHYAALSKLGSLALAAEVFGISKIKFVWFGYARLLAPELLNLFLLVFSFSFSSFSVPLIAGGGYATNLEVLIFEKIFIDQNWSMALTISLFQSLILFILSYSLFAKSEVPKTEFSNSKYLSSHLGTFLLMSYLIIYFGGYFWGVISSFAKFELLATFKNEIVKATIYSLSQLVLVLSVNLFLLFCWLLNYIENRKIHWVAHYFSMSTVVVGFAFYLIFPQTDFWDFIKIPLAISLIYFLVLTKSFIEKPLMLLSDQILAAQIFGISHSKIIFKVILPQIYKPISTWLYFLILGFLAEFALLRALGTRQMNLGLMAESFLSSYRIELSFLLSFWIILIWLILVQIIHYLLEKLHGTD